MKVLISAGHSNTDPGAVGTYQGKQITEAEVVTDFRNLVAYYLREKGIEYETDGTGSNNLPLREAIKLAHGKDLAIEFHCNAFSKPTATGVETLGSDSTRKVGQAICNAIAEVLGIANRGAKGEASGQHSRLGFVQAGGLIVELFFISNPSDVEKYMAKKWLVAKAVAEVIEEFTHGNLS